MIMCFLLSMGVSNVLGQEVRGVETKRVKYYGSQYNYKIRYGQGYRSLSSSEYYGWEFHNANSISVAVDIELWLKNGGLQKTKSVVLEPSEKYIFKFEEYDGSHCHHGDEWLDYDDNIEHYYVTYKAFKLQ